MREEEKSMFYCINNIWLVECIPLDTWLTGWITIELLHALLMTFGLLHE